MKQCIYEALLKIYIFSGPQKGKLRETHCWFGLDGIVDNKYKITLDLSFNTKRCLLFAVIK